jgi:glycine cleavage system regulatory protein
MSRLAGKFAGIVLLTVAEERLEALIEDLDALSAHGLQVALERTDSPPEHHTVDLRLELFGVDHPGIVAEISAALAGRGISIEEISTDVREAPMGGGTVFEAFARLSAPPTTSTEGLRTMLEALAHDLMVEIRLSND